MGVPAPPLPQKTSFQVPSCSFVQSSHKMPQEGLPLAPKVVLCPVCFPGSWVLALGEVPKQDARTPCPNPARSHLGFPTTVWKSSCSPAQLLPPA